MILSPNRMPVERKSPFLWPRRNMRLLSMAASPVPTATPRFWDDSHAAGGKAIDRRVNCASCHQKAEKEYKMGLHSKMIMKGTERAAYCKDCHGKHGIRPSKDPKSLTHLSNIARTCSRCHSDKEFVRQHAMGAGPSPGDLFKGSIPREGENRRGFMHELPWEPQSEIPDRPEIDDLSFKYSPDVRGLPPPNHGAIR